MPGTKRRDRMPSIGADAICVGRTWAAMHSLVCVKQVLDQEIPPRAFAVDRVTRKPDVVGAGLVMSIFDANALETAIRLRNAMGGIVTALSVGPSSADDVLRKALAVTADRALRIDVDAVSGLDPANMAAIIAAAIIRLAEEGDPVDLVVTGRQAGDIEHGQTGGMIAEALGWSCVPFVSRIEATEKGLRLRREMEQETEVLSAQLPLVVTVTNDPTNQLRTAKVRDVMTAHNKPVTTWSLPDLPLNLGGLVPRTEVVDLFVPERSSHCEWIEGENPMGKAQSLAQRLREMRLV